MVRPRRRGPATRPPSRSLLVLDSGGLTALAGGEDRARAVLTRALAEQRDVVVPAVVVAESTTGVGPRDAAVNRVVTSVGAIAPIDEGIARRAGRLRFETRCEETVDALVVAVAAESESGATILTGEHRAVHLVLLSEGLGRVAIART